MALALATFLVVSPALDVADHKPYFPKVREARAWLKAQYHHKYGSHRQWRCLDRLWEKESHWRVKAKNPTSGAFGIPQALPGRKMRSAGKDWRTNAMTQVKWGRRYIRARYGSPCRALRHQQRRGWY